MGTKKALSAKKLLVSITGWKRKHWQDKLKEINQYKIKEAALFMESFKLRTRRGLFQALKNSALQTIPLVHLRQDSTAEEIDFLIKNFNSRYFTIHESHFPILKKWRGYYKKLYLEMNYDNRVAGYVQVEKIAGFCIDLAHFQAALTSQASDYRYTLDHLKKCKLFCNHLSGYSAEGNIDLHLIKSVHDFDYIGKLPHLAFGKVIALEVYHPIRDQLKFHRHIKNIMQIKLKFKIN